MGVYKKQKEAEMASWKSLMDFVDSTRSSMIFEGQVGMIGEFRPRAHALSAQYHTWFRSQAGLKKQPIRSIYVIDFEATCNGNQQEPLKPQEIIEFPCVKVDTRYAQGDNFSS